MRSFSLTSLFFVTLSFVSTSIQVSANLYDLCYTGYYCNGNTDGVRGVITTADDCYQACLTLGTTTGKSYKFFDLTTNGQSECWCGETCTSKLPYDTQGYSMDGGVCLTDQPTEAPSSSPTTYQPSLRSQSPSNLPTSSQPSLMPSSSPTEIWSLCSSGLYCNGDTVAQRGIFTTAQQCYDQCNNLNQGYQFFDLTEGQGQCWCGTSCDSFLTFPTNGYRMNTGVCPPGNHMVSTSPTQHPTSSVLSEAQILQTSELEISSSTPGFPTPVINYSLPVKYSCSIDIKFPLKGKDWRNIFGQNADTVHYPGLYISVDNNMYIFHDGPSGIQFYGTQFYATLGQYFNLLWTVENGVMKVYVNGQYDGQLTAAFTWGGGSSLAWQWNVYLVSHYNVGYNGLVYVKNLRWWNRALTASEVTSLN